MWHMMKKEEGPNDVAKCREDHVRLNPTSLKTRRPNTDCLFNNHDTYTAMAARTTRTQEEDSQRAC